MLPSAVVGPGGVADRRVLQLCPLLAPAGRPVRRDPRGSQLLRALLRWAGALQHQAQLYRPGAALQPFQRRAASQSALELLQELDDDVTRSRLSKTVLPDLTSVQGMITLYTVRALPSPDLLV